MRISDWSSYVLFRSRLELFHDLARIFDHRSDIVLRRRQIDFAEMIFVLALGRLQPLEHRIDLVGRYVGRRLNITRQQAVPCKFAADRKSVVERKRVSVRVDLGGRRSIKKKKQQITK